MHALALKKAVVSPPGDYTLAATIEGGSISESSILISAVLVPAAPFQRLVVAFGDSITDGDGSTPDAERNWPSDLVRRLRKTPEGSQVAVVNEGIAGNRLLSDGSGASAGFGVSALARFDRDALTQPGVTHIVLLEGTNDIGFPGARQNGGYLADPSDAHTSEDLIAAYRQLISRAHARGIKVIGATITPFEGVEIPGYYSPAKKALRQTVNRWIRTSNAFDGVIDFDALLHCPPSASTDRCRPESLDLRSWSRSAASREPPIFGGPRSTSTSSPRSMRRSLAATRSAERPSPRYTPERQFAGCPMQLETDDPQTRILENQEEVV